MNRTYDPHRAHPDTQLALVAWALDGGFDGPMGTSIGELMTALREECRLPRTAAELDAVLLEKAKAYFAKFVQPHSDVNAEWAELEQAGVARVTPGVLTAPAPSGPTGAAAKESREDIAAPGGAAITEPDPCGCEATDALKAQLAALRARNFDLSTQLSRIRRLARASEVEALFSEIDREP